MDGKKWGEGGKKSFRGCTEISEIIGQQTRRSGGQNAIDENTGGCSLSHAYFSEFKLDFPE